MFLRIGAENRPSTLVIGLKRIPVLLLSESFQLPQCFGSMFQKLEAPKFVSYSRPGFSLECFWHDNSEPWPNSEILFTNYSILGHFLW